MTLLSNLTGVQTELWVWALITLVIFSPIVWVRNVEVFKVGYVYGVLAILFMVLVVSVFCTLQIHE